jgi:hypothetical protein
MGQVGRLCERATWVEAGCVQQDGWAATVLAECEATMASGSRRREFCAFAVSPFEDFAPEVPLAPTPKAPIIS